MHLQTFFVLSFFSVAYASIGPITDLYILNKIIAPDGYSRSTVLAANSTDGGSMPGPVITGNKGDQFSINVHNLLNDNTMLTTTSIHWHGIFQNGTNWADGPVGISQCPIVQGNSFLYQFTVHQAGTFWYHSHHSTQYCDGLRGALIIYDPNDPLKFLYDVDDESTVIALSEWYHPPSLAQGVNPNYDSTLVNGLGRYIGGPASPLAVVNVNYGTRYRTIIEVDGKEVVPLTVDSIDIYAGQRYSFVLKANQPIANYWIRSVPGPGPTGFENNINSAILRYAGASAVYPKTPQTTSVKALNETDLMPLQDQPAPGAPCPGGADININLNITFNNDTSQYFINGATFTPPSIPVLLQILSGSRTAQSLLPQGSVYLLPPNKVVEVTIPGGSDDSPHPFHLHGQNFAVIRSAGSTSYDYLHPVRRDVVNTGVAGDNVTFRFTTDNPGPWVLHCHINWHLILGLAIVFVTDVNEVASFTPPSAWDQLCPAYNVSGLS